MRRVPCPAAGRGTAGNGTASTSTSMRPRDPVPATGLTVTADPGEQRDQGEVGRLVVGVALRTRSWRRWRSPHHRAQMPGRRVPGPRRRRSLRLLASGGGPFVVVVSRNSPPYAASARESSAKARPRARHRAAAGRPRTTEERLQVDVQPPPVEGDRRLVGLDVGVRRCCRSGSRTARTVVSATDSRLATGPGSSSGQSAS
jgi:hypothetical protein